MSDANKFGALAVIKSEDVLLLPSCMVCSRRWRRVDNSDDIGSGEEKGVGGGDCVVAYGSLLSIKWGNETKDRRIHSRDLSAKADACIDLTVRRLVQFSLAGAFGGLLLFRSPTARWASVAFGAGIGFGSAYIESSYIFSEPQKSYSTDVFAISSPCVRFSAYFLH
ncbi:hypothetical protein KSP40_PGU006404 [Platanthera guangdongensis]|uniref:MICOS complex subunit MIC10 n=1 Tax=Platanthera guangdongensis TaxID=2320717 RepID=A0ABR2MV94_9ASPA